MGDLEKKAREKNEVQEVNFANNCCRECVEGRRAMMKQSGRKPRLGCGKWGMTMCLFGCVEIDVLVK